MAERTLYLQCSSGISGDMSVAALIDLGADAEKVLHDLATLPLEGYEVEISRVVKSGIDACDFAVILDKDHENHDHDMAYLHDLAGCVDGDHHHAHGHSHAHDNNESTTASRELDHTHAHSHRGLKEISEIIEASRMTDGAKQLAHKIFRILAEAEARAHGLPIDEVHFHEVGAVDSIVDICAIAIAYDNLAVDQVIVTGLAEGQGLVRCQHGLLPIPVPAVTFIASEYGIPLSILPIQGELVTPTGAAFVAAVRTKSELPEAFTINAVGYGAGKRDYATSGLLRAMLIEAA